jgi:hypothetical protein
MLQFIGLISPLSCTYIGITKKLGSKHVDMQYYCRRHLEAKGTEKSIIESRRVNNDQQCLLGEPITEVTA